jgi:uncharacterized protein
MIEAAQRYFRKVVFRTYRHFRHPRVLKKSPVRAWFARHFLDKVVWKPTQHTMAGGLAIGMAVMIQMAPGQMPVAAVLAALFRVNIPIAIIACWVSNPVTFAPFIYAQQAVGEWLMPRMPELVNHAMHQFAEFIVHLVQVLPEFLTSWLDKKMLEQGATFIANMYLGGIVLGAGLGVVSYPVAWLGWEVSSRLNHWRKRQHLMAGV